MSVYTQRWPSEVQDFKRVTLEFFQTTARLAERVLSAMARGLRLKVREIKSFDTILTECVHFVLFVMCTNFCTSKYRLFLQDPNFFKQCHHMDSIPGGTTMRMLYYPPLPDGKADFFYNLF